MPEEGETPKEVTQRHARDDRAGGQVPARARQRRRVPAADGDRQSACDAALHRSGRTTQTSIIVRPTELPAEPKEIKPHPYGVELGRLVTMLKDTKATTITQFLTEFVFARQSRGGPTDLRSGQTVSTRASTRTNRPRRGGFAVPGDSADQDQAPSTDCVIPIGEELLLKGLHHVVPGEFYCAATRPPAVYRGNPFQIEVALAYGGGNAVQKISLELLTNC